MTEQLWEHVVIRKETYDTLKMYENAVEERQSICLQYGRYDSGRRYLVSDDAVADAFKKEIEALEKLVQQHVDHIDKVNIELAEAKVKNKCNTVVSKRKWYQFWK